MSETGPCPVPLRDANLSETQLLTLWVLKCPVSSCWRTGNAGPVLLTAATAHYKQQRWSKAHRGGNIKLLTEKQRKEKRAVEYSGQVLPVLPLLPAPRQDPPSSHPQEEIQQHSAGRKESQRQTENHLLTVFICHFSSICSCPPPLAICSSAGSPPVLTPHFSPAPGFSPQKGLFPASLGLTLKGWVELNLHLQR